MSIFICPVCKGSLYKQEKTLTCQNNHCYDLAKQGYVNLLQTQKSHEKRHGDDKLMVTARQQFLDKGYYKPLLDAIIDVVMLYVKPKNVIIDAGCGEGYYTCKIKSYLEQNDMIVTIGAIDISKDALIGVSKRSNQLELAVASVFDIPVADNSCDMLLNFFAPVAKDEYVRILKSDGVFISAVPLERHLWSLKKVVYDKPYENEIGDYCLDGFELVNQKKVCNSIDLISNDDIKALFMMTPYYYKTSKYDQQKLDCLDKITVETEFMILTYVKK